MSGDDLKHEEREKFGYGVCRCRHCRCTNNSQARNFYWRARKAARVALKRALAKEPVDD